MTYFKLFYDSLELLEPLTDTERGRLFTAVLEYANTGEIPALTGNERFIFPIFRQQVDRDKAEYEQFVHSQRVKGAKGGRPRTCKENPELFSDAAKTQDKDKDKDKDQDKDQDKGQDQDKDEDEGKDGVEAGVAAVAALAEVWNERMGSALSTRGRKELARFVTDMGPACCLRAFDAALDAGRPNWAYVRGILRVKQSQGVRSPEDWERLEQQRERARRGVPSTQPTPQRAQKNSDWLDAFLQGAENREQEGDAQLA